ncbi:MAG: T9SS type A sorting domain-containing protein [Vicingus serpentipes]|nr:T9SS type A sorting domain-containing protein [Vicingus serpentipes]
MSITTYRSFICKLFIVLLFSFTTSLYAQDTLYLEDFTYPDGTIVGGGNPAAWTIDISGGDFGVGDYFETRSNKFEGRDVDGTVLWISQWINVQDFTNVTISGNFEEQNTDDGSDFIKAFYKTSASGSEIAWFDPSNQEFGSTSASINIGDSIDSLQIIIKVNNNSSTETHNFDNILVTGVSGSCTTIAGTAIAAPINIEHNQSTTLTLNGHSGTIQWQQSTDGINFSDIVGATTTPYTTASLLGPGSVYFRAKVTDSCVVFSDTATVTINAFPGTICVLNTNNDGAGSLRDAINTANSNGVADVISFCIDGNAPHTITLNSQLPDITENDITIDASTQTGSAAFKIVLDGNNAVNTGINILNAENVVIKGLSIINFTDNGIAINGSTSSGSISENHIAGNGNHGIDISLTNPNYSITGNLIGTDETGTLAQSNGGDGIHANNTGGTITIGGANTGEGNIISANVGDGLELSATSGAFIVQGNSIGTGTNGTEELGNGEYGVETAGTTDNILIGGTNNGEGNIIAFNGEEGVCVCSATNYEVEVRKNSFFGNSQTTGNGGIRLVTGANNGIQSVLITSVTSSQITGESVSNGVVELFMDDSYSYCEGKILIGSTVADQNGNWSLSLSMAGDITATVTDVNGNTSGFSSCVPGTITVTLNPDPEGMVNKFFATPSNFDNYEFFINGISAQNSGDNNFTANLLEGGDVVTVVAMNGVSISEPSNSLLILPPSNGGFPLPALQANCNLVPNPSFEDYSSCPTDISGGGGLDQINKILPWYRPTLGTPDYFNCNSSLVGTPNNLFGSQLARGGSGYVGMHTTGQVEFVQSELLCELEVGQVYDVIMYVSLAENSKFATKGPGIYLSTTPVNNPISGPTPLPFTPQVASSSVITNTGPVWIQLRESNFIGGGEKFITIGNFLDAASSMITPTGFPSAFLNGAYYYVDDISIIPQAPQITATQTTICEGESVTLSATGAASYLWSNGATTSSITVSPTTTTTYTVEAILDCACPPPSATFTVTVNPLPPVNAGDDVIICAGESTTLMAGGGTSFSWTPATGLDDPNIATPNASPTATTTYTVTGTDANGCVNTDDVTVTIDNSCVAVCGTQSQTISGTHQLSDLITAGTLPANTIVGATIAFDANSILNVDVPYTLNATNFIMRKDAQINIQSGVTLTITNNSHLFSCTELWNGIFIPDNTSTLIIDGNSSVEDAETAIVSTNGGVYQLDGAILNKNFKHIVVNAFTAAHTATVVNSMLSCNASATSPGNTLKVPRSNQRTSVGVEITDVANIQMGDPAFGSNSFDNMDFGITNVRSNLSVFNNNFTNIITPPNSACPTPPTPCILPGIAIWSSGDVNNAHTIDVGDGTALATNTFNNCTEGVRVEDRTTVNILNNSFIDVRNGIFITNCIEQPITVNDNTLNNFSNAILCFDNRTGNIEIDNNNLIGNPTVALTLGIAVQEVIFYSNLSSGDEIRITNNTIDNIRTGIWATTIADDLLLVEGNTITNIKDIGISAFPSYGIRVENCVNSEIVENNIWPVIAATAAATDRVRGVDVTLSGNTLMNNNTITEFGSGIIMRGVNINSSIRCNVLDQCQRGFFLETATIGTQGSSTNPSDNQWFGTAQFDIVSNSLGIDPDWFIRGDAGGSVPAVNFNPTLDPTDAVLLQTPVTGAPFNCNAAGQCSSPSNCLQQALLLFVNNQVVFPTLQEENMQFAKEFAYSAMMANDSIMNMGTPEDTAILQHFFDSVKTTAIGQLVTVGQLLCNSDYAQAHGLNASIVPNNLMESNQQSCNAIYCLWAAGNELTTAQFNEVEGIAAQCPLLGGKAVFAARTMLQLLSDSTYEYDDSNCGTASSQGSSESSKKGEKVQEEIELGNSTFSKEAKFTLYPNPTNGNMFLEYSLGVAEKGVLQIVDVTGKLQESFPLTSGANNMLKLNLVDYENGIYLYKVIVNEQVVHTEKLLMIKQ